MSSFLDKLTTKWQEGKFVCVGLDQALFEFNEQIIDQTHDLVCCYKLNSAFFEAEGSKGWEALKKTIHYIHQSYPDIPVILDAKRGDIGNTNEAYAKAVFDDLKADAVTIHPYLGKEAAQPFLDRRDKGIFVLVRTSNLGTGEFQDLKLESGKPLYLEIAEHVAKEWNKNGNCGVVVGASSPNKLKEVRKIVGDMPILIPGIGAQGGELENTVKYGINSKGMGIIIHSARGIIFAPNPRQATLDLDSQIRVYLKLKK